MAFGSLAAVVVVVGFGLARWGDGGTDPDGDAAPDRGPAGAVADIVAAGPSSRGPGAGGGLEPAGPPAPASAPGGPDRPDPLAGLPDGAFRPPDDFPWPAGTAVSDHSESTATAVYLVADALWQDTVAFFRVHLPERGWSIDDSAEPVTDANVYWDLERAGQHLFLYVASFEDTRTFISVSDH